MDVESNVLVAAPVVHPEIKGWVDGPDALPRAKAPRRRTRTRRGRRYGTAMSDISLLAEFCRMRRHPELYPEWMHVRILRDFTGLVWRLHNDRTDLDGTAWADAIDETFLELVPDGRYAIDCDHCRRAVICDPSPSPLVPTPLICPTCGR